MANLNRLQLLRGTEDKVSQIRKWHICGPGRPEEGYPARFTAEGSGPWICSGDSKGSRGGGIRYAGTALDTCRGDLDEIMQYCQDSRDVHGTTLPTRRTRLAVSGRLGGQARLVRHGKGAASCRASARGFRGEVL